MTPMMPVETLRAGDVILPPARELSLWMRRHARERGLSDAALNLTVIRTREGNPDTRGRWVVVEAAHTEEWGLRAFPFIFKARPGTLWPLISAGAAA